MEWTQWHLAPLFNEAQKILPEAESGNSLYVNRLKSIWGQFLPSTPSRLSIPKTLTEYQKAYTEQIYHRMARILTSSHLVCWREKLNRLFFEKLDREVVQGNPLCDIPPHLFTKVVHGNLLGIMQEKNFNTYFKVQDNHLHMSLYNKGQFSFVRCEEVLKENIYPTMDGFVRNNEILRAPTTFSDEERETKLLEDAFQVGLVERKMKRTFFSGSPHLAISLVEPYVHEGKKGVGKTLIGYTFDTGCCKKKKEPVTVVNDPMHLSLTSNPHFETISTVYRVNHYGRLFQWRRVIENLPDYLNGLNGSNIVRQVFGAVIQERDPRQRFSKFLTILAASGPYRRYQYKKALQLLSGIVDKVELRGDLKCEFKRGFKEVLEVVAKVYKDASLLVNCRYLARKAFRVIQDLTGCYEVHETRIKLDPHDRGRQETRQNLFWKVVVMIADMVIWFFDLLRDLVKG